MQSNHTHDTTSECQEVLARLYSFLDGELTETRRRKIQHHLDKCSPCLEAYEFEAELRQMIANRLRDHVPDLLRVKIAALIDLEKTSRARSSE